MNKTAKSFTQKRVQNSSIPISQSSKKIIKQELSIQEIYNEVRHKIDEMESAFKSQHMGREREMLKTYAKILDKIGAEVMTAKQKYLNLDKQNLKTEKRLQIVTELNKERQKCNILNQNIKSVQEEIKKYEDENNYLEKEVEALQNIADRKRSLSKSQHQQYRNNKQKAKSLQKRWSCSLKENDKFMTVHKATLENNDNFDIKNRAKSFMLNSQEPNVHTETENSQAKQIERPKTQQKYIGNRRRKNVYFNLQLQENAQLSEMI